MGEVGEVKGEEIQALRLEVQELRQFCLMLLYNVPSPGILSQTGLQLPQATKDYWWEKLGSHPKVEKEATE